MLPVLVELLAEAADVRSLLSERPSWAYSESSPLRTLGLLPLSLRLASCSSVGGGLLGGRPLAPLVLGRGLACPRPDRTKLCSSLWGLSLPSNSASVPGTEVDAGNGGRMDDE